jgi:hypothetical protein
MLRIFGLVPAFLLFLFIGNAVVFVPSQAYGWGCCRTACSPAPCQCVGSWPCLYVPDEPNTVPTDASLDPAPPQKIDIAGDILSLTAARADLEENLLQLTSPGKCFRDKLALALLGNARESLKFVPARFDENKLVSFLIDADRVE